MSESVLLDAGGRRRSPATLPGHHAGRVPRNKGQRYPADPPTVDEIVAVMRQTTDDRHGYRMRAMIVVLWRAGLRVHEALSLLETDLDERRGSLLVRRGKGGRRRETGMDAWGWEQLRPWLAARADLPIGPLFCVIDGPTRGRGWSGSSVRFELHRLATQAGVRRRRDPGPDPDPRQQGARRDVERTGGYRRSLGMNRRAASGSRARSQPARPLSADAVGGSAVPARAAVAAQAGAAKSARPATALERDVRQGRRRALRC
jgi:hypothetical protein